MTNTNRYPAQVFWNEDDKGFIAVAPDLPGCSAFGQTQQEALHELQDAIQAWIEAAQAAGNPDSSAVSSRKRSPPAGSAACACRADFTRSSLALPSRKA